MGMKTLLSMLVVVFSLIGGGCERRPAIKSEDEKTLYALGLMLGRGVGRFNLSARELDVVKTGFSDAVLKRKPAVEPESYGPKIDAMARTRWVVGDTP